nr:glycosyltransferase family 2 protein [Oceanococcus sp. HetDA_MAG_MS8]
MTAPPLVSIVLPTKNRLSTLPRSVASVCGQCYRNWELIIVDDHSTDATQEWVSSLRDRRVRYLRLESSQGAAAARNFGVKQARGEWIAFQDSDDEWVLDKLDKQLFVAQAGGFSWVGGSIVTWSDGGVVTERWTAPQGYTEIRHDAVVRGAGLMTPSWLVRRNVLENLGGFDESLPCLEDWELLFRLKSVYRMGVTRDIVLMRYGSSDSLFAELDKRVEGLQGVLLTHIRLLTEYPRWRVYWELELARLYGLQGQYKQAVHQALQLRGGGGEQWRSRVSLLWAALHRSRARLHGVVLKPPIGRSSTLEVH